DRELVRESERDREVRVEMDEVPGLVRQASPRGRQRQHGHGDQQEERRDRRYEAVVVIDEVTELRDDAEAVVQRIPDRLGDPMPDQQPQDQEPVAAVQYDQPL